MPIFTFGVWSTSNLLGANISPNQTNGNSLLNSTLTIGTEAPQTLSIEDTDPGGNDLFLEDDLNRQQFLTEAITINGNPYPIGTQVQAEFTLTTDFPDPDGGFVEIVVLRFDPEPGGANSGLTTSAYVLTGPIPDGTVITITSVSDNAGGPTAPAYSSFVCFAAGTLVKTDAGETPIERLRVGDLVETLDAGLQPVRWVGARSMKPAELAQNPKLQPIRITAGAFAKDVPVRDLIVSPQHRILVRSKIAERMFDEPEVLVRAKDLLELPGVEVATDLERVTYVHIMCDDHQIIFAQGAYAETLYTGKEAIKALSQEAQAEIADIFSEVPYLDRPLSRPSPKPHALRKLVARHVKNGKAIVQNL